jgi:hypothetical protein
LVVVPNQMMAVMATVNAATMTFVFINFPHEKNADSSVGANDKGFA